MAQVRQDIEHVGTRDATNLIALGRFVRTRRRTLELTQSQLAERLGWVQERISLLENGKYGLPSLPSLALLSSAIESELGDVLVSAGYESALESSEPNLEVWLGSPCVTCTPRSRASSMAMPTVKWTSPHLHIKSGKTRTIAMHR